MANDIESSLFQHARQLVVIEAYHLLHIAMEMAMDYLMVALRWTVNIYPPTLLIGQEVDRADAEIQR